MLNPRYIGLDLLDILHLAEHERRISSANTLLHMEKENQDLFVGYLFRKYELDRAEWILTDMLKGFERIEPDPGGET